MSDASAPHCPRCDQPEYACQCGLTTEERFENLSNWYRADPRTVVPLHKWWGIVSVEELFETQAEGWAELDRQSGRGKSR